MKKFLIILLVFWWALIFPELSINSLTSDNSINYLQSSINDTDISYTFWFKTFFDA